MINQLTIVGRLVHDPEIIENLDNGNKECIITLAVDRCFKNQNGIYETDFIKCKLYHQLARSVKEYCLKGDLIGIHGRLECLNKNLEVVAEKVSFLASKK